MASGFTWWIAAVWTGLAAIGFVTPPPPVMLAFGCFLAGLFSFYAADDVANKIGILK
jgi:hypothetical protein